MKYTHFFGTPSFFIIVVPITITLILTAITYQFQEEVQDSVLIQRYYQRPTSSVLLALKQPNSYEIVYVAKIEKDKAYLLAWKMSYNNYKETFTGIKQAIEDLAIETFKSFDNFYVIPVTDLRKLKIVGLEPIYFPVNWQQEFRKFEQTKRFG